MLSYSVLYPQTMQWGFLPGKSAGSALLAVTDEWHQILEQSAEVGTIFFDLKKAFDTCVIWYPIDLSWTS